MFAMGAKTNSHKTLSMELTRATPRNIVGVLGSTVMILI